MKKGRREKRLLRYTGNVLRCRARGNVMTGWEYRASCARSDRRAIQRGPLGRFFPSPVCFPASASKVGLYGPAVTQDSFVATSATLGRPTQTATGGLRRVIWRPGHRFRGGQRDGWHRMLYPHPRTLKALRSPSQILAASH